MASHRRDYSRLPVAYLTHPFSLFSEANHSISPQCSVYLATRLYAEPEGHGFNFGLRIRVYLYFVAVLS